MNSVAFTRRKVYITERVFLVSYKFTRLLCITDYKMITAYQSKALRLIQIGYFYLPSFPVTWDGGLAGYTLNKCPGDITKLKVSMVILNILGTACVYNFLTWPTCGREEHNIGTAFLHLICTTIAYYVNSCVYLLFIHQEVLKSFSEMLKLQDKLQG